MGLLKRLRLWSRGRIGGASLNLIPSGFSFRNGTLASNETIFSAISMLSNAIASAPVTLRRRYRRVPPSEHDVAALLEYGPNPNMTTFQFIRLMETMRDATGAGYALRELSSAGRTAALWPIRTECVTPMFERDSRELYYRVRDPLDGVEVYLHNSFVLSVSHIGMDGITPLSPIDVLQSSLNYDREVKEFSIDQMKNGLRAKYAIKFPGNMSAKQFQEYNELFKTFQKVGVLYLDGNKDVMTLSNGSVIDPQVFQVENITVARVARVYNIPLEKFLPEKTSYSSAEQSDLNYLRDTILPIARMYEQEFSKKLLSLEERGDGMQIKMSLNGFARADMQTRGDFYMKGIRSGWFSVNDIRALEDMEPAEGGDAHYISRDLDDLAARDVDDK